MMLGHIYDINCDCCSYKMVRARLGKWIYGPRCQGCGRILGWMQWSYCGQAVGKDEGEILANWAQAREAAEAAKGSE